MVYFFSVTIIRLFIFLFCKVTWLNRLPDLPPNCPLLIASKHWSWKDIPLLGYVSRRPLRFIAKKELWQIHPIVSWWLDKVGAIAIDRQNPKPSTLKKAIEILKSGQVVAIFPEGTRDKSPEINHYFEGVGFMASKAKAVTVTLAAYCGGLTLRLGFIPAIDIRICFGNPTETTDLKLDHINECLLHDLKEVTKKVYPSGT